MCNDKSIIVRLAIGLLSLFFLTLQLHAEEPCFVQANSYYEQIYCEVKTKSAGRSLPRFYDFQKNNELTQALLLKRPARKLGIDLLMPKGPAGSGNKKPADPLNLQTVMPVDQVLSGCELSRKKITCGASTFHLLGNQANKHLAPEALSDKNQLNIPVYSGHSNEDLRHYLVAAYQLYLDKLMSIGLAGSTMSYAKFNYLYFDLLEKGADFSERSKSVFNFLKKDKRSIAVSEKITPSKTLMLSGCTKLNKELIVCESSRKNYLYKTL